MPRLHRSKTRRAGIGRMRSGAGFRYLDADGATLEHGDVRDRVEALAIPPAWTDVWISPDELGHIQALGTDAAGRRQYIYHPDWRVRQDRTKFERALQLAATLSSARGMVTRDLHDTKPSRERALAAAFRILDSASPRVGGESYLESSGSRGLSTLLCAHASVRGDTVTLAFVGKGGLDWESDIDDADLARVIRSLRSREPNARLLAWRDGETWHPVSAADINDYVRERTRGDFTAKDFRTLRGTIVAARSLAASGTTRNRRERQRAITAAITDAAAVLGNTPTIARKSYVDPRVVECYRRGRVMDAAVSDEHALLALLGAARTSG